MPIFEYVCKDCSRTFEALVMNSQEPECPACHGRHLEQIALYVCPARHQRRSRSRAESRVAPAPAATCPHAGMMD